MQGKSKSIIVLTIQKAIAAVADETLIFFKNGNFILEYGPRKFFGSKTFPTLGKKQCKK